MINAKKTIKKLKGEVDRKRMSLYLSESIFTKFKAACENIPPSRVMEELMKEFIKSKESSKNKKSPS
jgi:hypothetical protein